MSDGESGMTEELFPVPHRHFCPDCGKGVECEGQCMKPEDYSNEPRCRHCLQLKQLREEPS